MSAAVPTDEIYERYLRKAITEINELGDELARTGDELRVPVVGSGQPLADVFLLKHAPQHQEIQEGVAFFGRSGRAVLKSLQRLHVDPLAVYGTNCLKFGTEDPADAASWLTREIHIVQPKLVVVMGERAVAFLNDLRFPLSDALDADAGGVVQRFTPTIAALVTPDVDERSTSSPPRPRSGTPSRRSGRGGRSSLRTDAASGRSRSRPLRRARGVRRGRRGLPGCPRAPRSRRRLVVLRRSLRRSGSRFRWRRGRPTWSARGRRDRRRGVGRLLLRGSRRRVEHGQAHLLRPRRILVPVALRVPLVAGARGAPRAVGGHLVGRVRADEVRHRGAAWVLRERLGRVARAGRDGDGEHRPPDIVFFALFLAAAQRFDLRIWATWVWMTGFLSTTLILVWALDSSGLPALPAVCWGFLLPNADLIWRDVRDAYAAYSAKREEASESRACLPGPTPLEQRDRLDVRRVREHVDRTAAQELVAEVVAQHLHIGCEGCRVARDVDDSRRPDPTSLRSAFPARPARGGSTTTTSGGPASSTSSSIAWPTLPAKNARSRFPFSSAFSIAHATASSEISRPQTSRACPASDRPIVPVPQ